MAREITISEQSISWIAVHGRYYITSFFFFLFFFLERYAPTTTFFWLFVFFCLSFWNFVPYTLFLILTLCGFCFPIKYGFLNLFTSQANMNCFYLSTFYSVLMFLDFYMITYFGSHYFPENYDYFRYYCCCY